MGQAYWAAREGDILLHTSLLADIIGAAVEVVCETVLAGACFGAAVLLIGSAGTAACVVGVIASVVASIVLEKKITQAGDFVSSLLSPSEDGRIKTGSQNTHTNSLPSARAAGIVKKAETEQAPQQPESFIDIAGNILWGLGQAVSDFFRPTVASPDPNTTEPREDDKIICKKHPSFEPGPGTNSVVSAVIEAISGAPEYMAEGSKKVYINSQPAVRSNDRSTCEAKVTDDYKGGIKVSNNVRIGGESVVVREIKSGKHPIALIATIAALFFRKGKLISKLGRFAECFIKAAAIGYIVSKAIEPFRGNPVHLPTGAKLLFGPEELDFSLPAHLPFEWQRFYSSVDTRTHNMFGAGWSV
ncbi:MULTISPECIES: DUF6531 domain-containing protein, partial [unclassified Snodgrassella]|uniref:DUF6531 domain-containing protein n=1 Tax=unclassified Snodgrassella TaxID=2625236 RepID=UPI0018DB532B